MKNIISCFIALSFALSIAGCGEDSGVELKNINESAERDEKKDDNNLPDAGGNDRQDDASEGGDPDDDFDASNGDEDAGKDAEIPEDIGDDDVSKDDDDSPDIDAGKDDDIGEEDIGTPDDDDDDLISDDDDVTPGDDDDDVTTDDDDDSYPPLEETEFRGLWVTRWDYSNAADVKRIMGEAVSGGFNTVLWQVRGEADAFYKSKHEPWAKRLSGTLGKDPGWDPLAVAVEEGHKLGLEVHAWLNTFTAWSGATPPTASIPAHILNAHPEWRQVDSDGVPMAYGSGYVCVSPGIPAVREHITNVAKDIAENYDVDGIHFDYIRYAGPKYSHDSVSVSRYNEAKKSEPTLTFGDWQREQITDFVQNAYIELTGINQKLQVSAAVWGIYKDTFGWGGTSQGYYDYYQDSHRWMKLGILDFSTPMIYWKTTSPKGGKTDFATLTDDFLANAGERYVFPGINGEFSFEEIEKQIEYSRQAGSYGTAIFTYSYVKDKELFDDFLGSVYKTPRPVPPMPWKKVK